VRGLLAKKYANRASGDIGRHAKMIRQATAADTATILAMLWEARDQIGLSQDLNFDSDAYREWMRGLCAEKQVRVF
jgi:hypothetical protein